jgi:hypothetical protein
MSQLSPSWPGTPIEKIIRQFEIVVTVENGSWRFERTDGTPETAKPGPNILKIAQIEKDEEVQHQLCEWLGFEPINVVRIYKAEAVGHIPVTPVQIIIDQPIPRADIESGVDIMRQCDEMFWTEAEKLAAALYHALPQGLRGKLIAALMKYELDCFYGVAQIPLDARLLNWLEDRRQTVDLHYDEINLWTLEDILDNKWEGFTLRECLMKASAENAGQFTVAATTKEFDPAQYPADHNQDLWEEVPKHLRDGLRNYFMTRRPTGGFLRAVLEGNLFKAHGSADPASSECMPAICSYIYNCAPAESYGSPEKVAKWIEVFPDCCNFHANGGAATTPCLVE